MYFVEERKADIDGFEIPIQCLIQTTSVSKMFSHAHYHDYVELLYGIDSDATVWINGEESCLKTGDLLVINSKKPHTVYSKSSISKYIVIKFMPQILYAAEQSVFEFKYIIPFLTDAKQYSSHFPCEAVARSEIPAIMNEITEEWSKSAYGYEIALRICVNRIVLWLLRNWNKSNDSAAESFSVMSTVQKTVEYANKHIQDADLHSAARECGLSYSYLSRVFKRIMKKSFSEYLCYIRIAEAQRLLASTDKSITEIAQEVGFSTASHFIETFKKQVHVTPSKFRKSLSRDPSVI